jgi:hypothetical protein
MRVPKRKELKMNKDITICFRTKTNLKKSLEAIARYNRWSLSSTIENILVDYVDRVPVPEMEEERRKSPRKNVMLPALITRFGEKDAPKLGIIKDISETGLQISLSKTSNFKVEQDDKDVPLNVTFYLPNQSTPVTISCLPLRSQMGEESIEMGVTITGIDPNDYKRLFAFLSDDDREL